MTEQVAGMLYLVSVRMVVRDTREKMKKKILLVGRERSDIERRLRWSLDLDLYDEFSITNVKKLSGKVHVLSTYIEQPGESSGPVINRDEGTVVVQQTHGETSPSASKRYAVGVTTTMFALNEMHAIRKVGAALVNRGTGEAERSPSLSQDATVMIEELTNIPSKYAKARDVSAEVNRAHFVRG